MPGRVHSFFTNDHRRLEALLEAASAPESIAEAPYREFRAGILKHIGWEEKVLIPALRRLRRDAPIPGARQITLDHGAIVALMVPPPTHGIIKAVKAILGGHNHLEEDPGGLYALCDELPAEEILGIMDRVRRMPDVPVQPHNPKPDVLEVTRRALQRAGYNLDEYLV